MSDLVGIAEMAREREREREALAQSVLFFLLTPTVGSDVLHLVFFHFSCSFPLLRDLCGSLGISGHLGFKGKEQLPLPLHIEEGT
jgi:hypothetical protein